MGGKCPSTHPVKIPQVPLEVYIPPPPKFSPLQIKTLTTKQIVWDTTKFNNKADWPADGSQPFVLSHGDTYVHTLMI
jgi:hypothetical protein